MKTNGMKSQKGLPGPKINKHRGEVRRDGVYRMSDSA